MLTRALRTLAGLASATLAAACSQPDLPRPDLLLITTSALSVEALTCHGGEGQLGSDVCSVGDEGSRFVWAFASAGSAAPAMASLLTGLPPAAHGVHAGAASFLRQEAQTVAEQLSRHGYATAAFVHEPSLNRSRHFDQGFALFDDGSSHNASSGASGAADEVSHAAHWLGQAPSPFFAWVHIEADPPAALPDEGGSAAGKTGRADRLRDIDRDLSRLLTVFDARSTLPAILLTSLPGDESTPSGLTPGSTRVALLWRPPRVGSGRGITRVIRTPVSQLDVAPTLLRAAGIAHADPDLTGRPLPFREQRSDEAGRTLEIQADDQRALIGEGVYLVIDDAGEAVGVAQLPLAGDRAPELTDASRSEDLVSRLWAAPEKP